MDGVPIKPKKARTIYVATDDQRTLKEEIAKLPKGQGGTTIVGGESFLFRYNSSTTYTLI